MSEVPGYAPAAPAAPAEPGSLPRRIVDVLFSPGALFERFRGRAPWIDVLVLTTVVTVAVFVFLPESLYRATAEAQIAMKPELAGTATVEQMARYARWGGALSVPVLGVVVSVLYAGFMTAVFRFLHGGDAGFRQYLAIVAHSGVIGMLGMLVTVPLWLMRGDMTVRLSLALLAPFLDPGTYAYRLLNGLDVFVLWSLAVMAVGVQAVNRKVSFAAAAGWLFATSLALAAIGALLGG